MVKENKWKLVWYYPRGSFLFSKPSAKEMFKSKRCQELSSIEVIIVLELISDAESKTYNLDATLKIARKDSKNKPGFLCKPKRKQVNCERCGK